MTPLRTGDFETKANLDIFMNENLRATIVQRAGMMLCVCIAGLLSGCAAFTNPVANGIPVRMIPDELLAESKEGFEPIPWPLLQRTREKKSELVPGDILGIYVEGVLGNDQGVPPVNIPTTATDPPSIGYPIAIRNDGTISIPLTKPLKVAGLSIEEAEQKLIDAYTGEDNQILVPGEVRIILTMLRQKHAQINVIRQDTIGQTQSRFTPTPRGLVGNSVTAVNSNQQSRGFQITIPASEADVLSALNNTGGLPGLDAKPELMIYRRADRPKNSGDGLAMESLSSLPKPDVIPLRRKPDESLNIREEDVTLNDGDIVVVSVRKPEYFYAAGLLRNQQVPMPLDKDLTASQAVMLSGGPLINGGFGGGNFQGNIISNQLSSTNPSLLTILRRGPNERTIPIRVDLNEALRDPREDILIQDGDTLVLQQTTGEAFGRYFFDRLNVNTNGLIFQRQDANASGTFRVSP